MNPVLPVSDRRFIVGASNVLRRGFNGLIRADYRSSELGPRRKYYALTQTGRAALGDFLTHYRALERAVSRLIEETEKLEVQADE